MSQSPEMRIALYEEKIKKCEERILFEQKKIEDFKTVINKLQFETITGLMKELNLPLSEVKKRIRLNEMEE